jgi:hypothetical protein
MHNVKLLFLSNKIIASNILAVIFMTVFFNVIAYAASEAKGIGFLYFAIIGLVINMCVLLTLGLFSLLMKKQRDAKDFLRSIIYSVITFSSIQLIFIMLK